MFVDIRDFTPFAEANTAEDTVSRLNALFEIVVPAVLDTGGHVNKYLGDGALAVFGAPNVLTAHADAAVTAALQIHSCRRTLRRDLRIGIGINTGQVIAGTIGGAGKLEFTLIGDTVNVAARVEQLTKTTGDTILVTEQTLTFPYRAASHRDRPWTARSEGENGHVSRPRDQLIGTRRNRIILPLLRRIMPTSDRELCVRASDLVQSASANRRHSPGTPFNWCEPRSSNCKPEPTTRSRRVPDTRMSPAPASDETRAPI